jgi:hypothetical protein
MTQMTKLYAALDRALTLARPHGGLAVWELMTWLTDNLPERLQAHVFLDDADNMHIDNRKDKTHRTLFVAHLDSVHRQDGDNPVAKTEQTWSAAGGSCLGADDGAGVAVLFHMLWADVPGYYVFTQGEECGGIGAKHLAKHEAALLREFDRAVAFDRKDMTDVITHQGWGRCCSDAFAQALATSLNDVHPDYIMLMPDDTGIYTDTAEFVDIIPECTNISVGYTGAHGAGEALNVQYLERLADAAARIDWDGLPTTRDPSVHESVYDSWGEWYTTYGTGYGSIIPTTRKKNKKPKLQDYTLEDEMLDAVEDALYGTTGHLIALLAKHMHPDDPDLAKRFINRHALTDEVLEMVEDKLYSGESALYLLDELCDVAQIH